MKDYCLSRRRLIICCDGTWDNSIGKDDPLTNVSRLSRCIDDIAEDGVPQVVYYHYGIGNGTSSLGRIVDGATGRGITANMLHAYNHICMNFNNPDDEIYLVGFSRGAYTVHLLASFISRVGLLTKTGLIHLKTVRKLWALDLKHAPSDQLLEPVLDALVESDCLRRNVSIEACIMWDAVSALGIPMALGIPSLRWNGYEVEDKVPPKVKNIFHALALNEYRKDFKPVIFTDGPQSTTLKQCWFLGAHSNVGGGCKDIGLANITLVWMIAQLETHTKLGISRKNLKQLLVPEFLENWASKVLAYDTGVASVPESRAVHWKLVQEEMFRLGRGHMYKSHGGVYKLSGTKKRTLGFQEKKPAQELCFRIPGSKENRFCIGTQTGVAMSEAGAAARQTLHFTVRVMLAKRYRGFTCPVLKDYRSIPPAHNKTDTDCQHVTWRRDTPKSKSFFGGSTEVMTNLEEISEDKVNEIEMELLKLWIEAEDKLQLQECQIRRNDSSALDENGCTLASFFAPLLDEAVFPKIMYTPPATKS